jgi:hypoxanthine phosphoribosyltransferase
MDMLRVNWDSTVRHCEELGAAVGDFRPDMIVGLSRGGLVPARIMADIMGVKEIGILGINFYKAMGKPSDFPRITQELTMDLAGKKILIVDDIAETGRSLMVAKDYLKRKGASEIRIAAIHYKPNSEFKPDYFAASTTAWVVYPWERHETERELRERG